MRATEPVLPARPARAQAYHMIVVTTPTGTIGRRVADLLVRHGSPVRVVARDPARLDLPDRVEVVTGSHEDPGVLRTAMAGADCLFLLVPPDVNAPDAIERYRRFARAAAAAAGRIVAVSTLGRGYPKPAGLLDAAFAMDDVIEAAGVEYRALRPAFFMENLLRQAAAIREHGILAQPLPAGRPLALTAADDIATAAAALLRDPTWTGQDSVPLVSPDDLSPDGMAAVLTEVLRRPVHYQEQTVADYRAMLEGFGMPAATAGAMADMAQAQHDGVYGYGPQPVTRTATGFQQWCAAYMSE
jgi:uncharacterized protein YbjT (DUF2867 family)